MNFYKILDSCLKQGGYPALVFLVFGLPLESTGAVAGADLATQPKLLQSTQAFEKKLEDQWGIELTAFHKDIRDLLGVEFITTYTGAQYPRLTNVDFGNVLGFTLAMDHRSLGPASVSVDYTWQQALGNSSDPQETASRAQDNEDPRPRLLPFNWDQRHTLNATASIGTPDNVQVSSIMKLASGQPYTPVTNLGGFNSGLVTNSGRRPLSFVMDLRAEKSVATMGRRASLFARVFNVFDTRYFNGFVFGSTGSPYYSRFPGNDEVILQSPTRFYPPRRFEIGIRFGS